MNGRLLTLIQLEPRFLAFVMLASVVVPLSVSLFLLLHVLLSWQAAAL